MASVEQLVYTLAEPIADKHGCELVDVTFKKEGSEWFLRLFIDKEGGVTLDDCEAVSRSLSDELDLTDPILQSYYLEVSSPGINRPLKKDKDFELFMGEQIEVKFYKALEGQKVIVGILDQYQEGEIYLKCTKDGSIIKIKREDAAMVRLAAY